MYMHVHFLYTTCTCMLEEQHTCIYNVQMCMCIHVHVYTIALSECSIMTHSVILMVASGPLTGSLQVHGFVVLHLTVTIVCLLQRVH